MSTSSALTTVNPDHYTYRVRWSQEDGEYVGTVAELPSLSWLEETQHAAFDGIRALVKDVLADMARTGEVPPAPLAERRYSGRFLVRVPEDVHRALVLDAAEQNISLNRLVSHRLSQA